MQFADRRIAEHSSFILFHAILFDHGMCTHSEQGSDAEYVNCPDSNLIYSDNYQSDPLFGCFRRGGDSTETYGIWITLQ